MKKKKINYRKTIFPKKPTYSNIIYYNSFSKLLLGMIVVIIGFLMYHYITFNHHKLKIKTVTSYKDRYIIPENIVFLGDSITDFYDLDKYYPDNSVVNSGINGNVSDDILNDMYNRVYKYNPSKVFLLIGTNQLMKDEDDEIVADIKSIIENIHDNRPIAKIYVESIYPVNKALNKNMVKNRENDRIIELNSKIKEMVKDIEFVEYINIHDSLLKDEVLNEEYSEDGLHLNDKGYEIVTNILKKYV